jgi:hypothetical protein
MPEVKSGVVSGDPGYVEHKWSSDVVERVPGDGAPGTVQTSQRVEVVQRFAPLRRKEERLTGS